MRIILFPLLVLVSSIAYSDDREWKKLDEGFTGPCDGSMLLFVPEWKQFLLVGPAQREWNGKERKGAFVQAYDPSRNLWNDFAQGPDAKSEIHSYYQTAFDPILKVVYCLSGGSTLYEFHLSDKTWKASPSIELLEDLSWQSIACDPIGRRLVVVGSDKRVDNLGWLRTVILDLDSGTWSRPELLDRRTVEDQKEAASTIEALVSLTGAIRLVWYRDPHCTGTEVERKSLLEQNEELKKRQSLKSFHREIDATAKLIADKQLLAGLKSTKMLQRDLEVKIESAHPVPSSRRNSPLVFDPVNKVFVLFGGDHEDYLMNDTWILDLNRKSWSRVSSELSPSPRAGHGLCYLPQSGRIALYEGYIASNSTDYAARPSAPINPIQLWTYDVMRNRWSLHSTWPIPAKGESTGPGPTGHFDGYAAEWFSPPAIASDGSDVLFMVSHARDGNRPSSTWSLRLDPPRDDVQVSSMLGTVPNQRLYRVSPFRADYCEVDEPTRLPELDELPENRWVKLPESPRNPCRGCRQRDWGTSVWDPDRDQILLWGGGHCVRSASTVVHYSPASGRIVEGYDADEPYGANGGGGFDSSLLNRPWVSTHNYKHYAYDPKCQLMVSGRGYLYDPGRMDWHRLKRGELPYRFDWGSTVLASSPHGAVAWARKLKGEDAGLWVFDMQHGWIDLEPKSKLFVPWCDSHGMVYDSKRDRMLFSSVGGNYGKVSDGTLLSFDFNSKAIEVISPANPELGRTECARELAYVEHADWVLIGHNVQQGDSKTGKQWTRIYDCSANRFHLLDAGPVPDGHEAGWMYDARRKLAYSFTTKGDAWAIRIVPPTARLLEQPK